MKKWYVPCLRGTVGDWVYYSALMKPEQIRDHIIASKNIRESEALDDFLQRTLKPRYEKIATYLLRREDRFFNSIIVGIFDGLPDWVQLDLAPTAEVLDIPEITQVEESLGLLLFFGNEQMFAIDGQHRVSGIVSAFSKNPERLSDDEYSIIFVAHKDDKNGKIRTRRLFSDINNNAVAVSPGDKVVIDEDDLCAIVTRRIYAEYPAFKGGREIAVTEQKAKLIQDGTERFTNLLALGTVCKRLKPLLARFPKSIDNSSVNVTNLQEIVTRFFDFVIEHEASFSRYFADKEANPILERENNRNIFFRPVGLELLAKLYAYFRKRDKLPVLAYGLEKLNFQNPGGILDGIIWNKGKIQVSSANAAFELCLYLLHEWDEDKNSKLLETLRVIRKEESYHLPAKVILPANDQ